MSRQTIVEPQAKVATRIHGGVLQRKCACGQHTSGGECEACRKKTLLQPRLAVRQPGDSFEQEADRIAEAVSDGRLRTPAISLRLGDARPVSRKETDERGPADAPPLVEQALSAPGRALAPSARSFMERRTGHDFSRVRVHTDALAGQSAREVGALAYTVGRDIVFAAGQYAPETPIGRKLIAHELVHVVQQSESRSPVVQRIGFFENIGVLFGLVEGDYSEPELRAYLGKIVANQRIEGDYDSDNKARDVVRKWKAGKLDLELFPLTKRLLIQEMQDGVVTDVDRAGISTLLESANRRDLLEIFGAGRVDPKQLLKDFDSGTYKQWLESFLNRRFKDGKEAVLQGGKIEPLGGVELKAMSPEKRRDFIEKHFEKGDRAFARQILDDLAESVDLLDFSDEAELATEIEKRMRTTRLMQETQKLFGRAFEYPNKPAAKACLPENKGKPLHEQKPYPRVNKKAESFWGPVKEGSPVPGWQSSYYFELSEDGKKNAYQALSELFIPQDSICKMTLIHCDYLASVVHLRAFAETLGVEKFNDRVRRGVIDMKLTYYGFAYLEPSLARYRQGLSLQEVRPSTEADLVIGDHVIFWNHRTYDLINEVFRNAWRLENAILTERKGGVDFFLGHGSGRQTKESMKEILAKEYNEVASEAKTEAAKTKSKNPQVAESARKAMKEKFPRIQEKEGEWRITGTAHQKTFDQPLKIITPQDPELLGLRDPDDPSKMNWVKRPIESR